jgi:hypothetical protein
MIGRPPPQQHKEKFMSASTQLSETLTYLQVYQYVCTETISITIYTQTVHIIIYQCVQFEHTETDTILRPYGILLRTASVQRRTERGQQTLNAESQLNEVLQITFQYQKSNVLT